MPGVAAAAAAALPLLEALRCVCGVRSDRWQLQAGLLHHSMYFITALNALVSLITAEKIYRCQSAPVRASHFIGRVEKLLLLKAAEVTPLSACVSNVIQLPIIITIAKEK